MSSFEGMMSHESTNQVQVAYQQPPLTVWRVVLTGLKNIPVAHAQAKKLVSLYLFQWSEEKEERSKKLLVMNDNASP